MFKKTAAISLFASALTIVCVLAACEDVDDGQRSETPDSSVVTDDGVIGDMGEGGHVDAESSELGAGTTANDGGSVARDAGSTRDYGRAKDAGSSHDQGRAEDAGPAPDPACAHVDPFPSALQSADNLSDQGASTIRFVARDGNVLTAYTHRSQTFDPQTGPIVFVIHGAGRNAESYLNRWRDAVDRAGALAIAPEFPSDLYPSSESYTFGVGVNDTPDSPVYDPAQWRSPDEYSYSEIEHLFEATRDQLGNQSCRYLIYGHSAGGQFVHRLITFRPDARVKRAVAANAGWYTMPSAGMSGDENYHVPYGLQGAPPDATRLERMFAHDLVILLGEEDTSRTDNLRTKPQADAQGQNRFERGHTYFDVAQREAAAIGAPYRWTLATVPGVGHSNSGMSGLAAAILFAP